MKVKTVNLAVKSAGEEDGLAEGEFTGYASVFDNIDLHGDVVRAGAFDRTLNEWSTMGAESGAVIPLLYGHDMDDPNNNIGHVIEAKDDGHGLLVRCKIDLEGGNGPQVYRLIKGRRLRQMSFAYTVQDSKVGEIEGRTYFELLDLDLHEVSLVPLGANPKTELLGVKSSSNLADEIAAEVTRRLADLLKSAKLVSTEEEQAEAEPEDEAEEPKGEKASNPTLNSAMLLLQLSEALN